MTSKTKFYLDVFIYRHFATYIPQNCTLLTGGGGYGTDFNRRKLKRIARDMNFSHVGLSGMGSTWLVFLNLCRHRLRFIFIFLGMDHLTMDI